MGWSYDVLGSEVASPARMAPKNVIGTAKMNQRVAIVTGAAGGIGFAIAEALAVEGYSVLMVDHIDPSRLSELCSEIAKRGATASGLSCDVSALTSHEQILSAASIELGGLSCLVNCAGVSVLNRGDILEVTEESYDRCQSINTRACFFLSQRVARYFLAHDDPGHHRSIVNISSCNAVAVATTRSEYCVSKAALSMVSRSFAVRLAPAGIGVYEVRPGIIETEMTRVHKKRYDAMIGGGLTAIPRQGTPDEVARVVCTLASGDLSYTCGQVIDVDGGLSIAKF